MGLGLGIPKRWRDLVSISTSFVDEEREEMVGCCLDVDGFKSSL